MEDRAAKFRCLDYIYAILDKLKFNFSISHNKNLVYGDFIGSKM